MRILLNLIFFVCFLFPSEGVAQFYKVYGYETTEKGETEVVIWNTFVAKSEGGLFYFGEPANREGLWAHSLEIEHGFTEKLTLAARADFLDPRDKEFRYVGARAVFFHYRFGKPGGSLFDPAILLEYSIPKSSFSDAEKLEIRIILERKLGEDIILRINPIFEKATSGHAVEEGLEFAYATGIYYSGSHAIQPALEFYGEIGELSNPEPFDRQEFLVFPTLNLHIWEFHWNIGAGFGITEESDDITIKSILSYGF